MTECESDMEAESEAGARKYRNIIREGTAVDPTKNVLDLVNAESKYQDGMRQSQIRLDKYARDSESRMQNYARETESRMQTWMRDAETKRIDQLASQKAASDIQISSMLAESVKSTSSLVSTQLVQIQSTFDARVNKLEEFRLLSTGRSSVADPALERALTSLASDQKATSTKFVQSLELFAAKTTEAMDKMSHSIATMRVGAGRTEGADMGKREMVAWAVSAATLAYFALNIFHSLAPMAIK